MLGPTMNKQLCYPTLSSLAYRGGSWVTATTPKKRKNKKNIKKKKIMMLDEENIMVFLNIVWQRNFSSNQSPPQKKFFHVSHVTFQ